MAKLSVVVCVYNTEEKLLKECLDSIYQSSLKEIEVIFVDDGSDKDYSKIIKNYKDLIYVKTENQGTLAARICGIKKASSDYICFADSDDIVTFDYYQAGVDIAQALNADIVFNDWAFFTQNSKYILKKDTTICENFYINEQAVLPKFFKSSGREHSYHVLWNKIFKRELLTKAADEILKLNINQKLCFAEDVLINYFAFKNATKITNVHLGYYFYRIHSSQQISANSEEKLKSHIDATALVFDAIEEDLKKTSQFEALCENLQKWKLMLCYGNYSVAKRANYKQLINYIKDKFKVEKLKTSPAKDSKIYAKHKLLPQNFDEIEEQIKKIYYSNKYLKIYVDKKSFAFNRINKFKELFKKRVEIVKFKDNANVVIKKEKHSFKQKLLHNTFVYKLGMLFVPKGSSMRNKLKAKI